MADFGVGFGFGEEGGVAFLPEEFAGAEEGFWWRVRAVSTLKPSNIGGMENSRGFLNSQRTTLFHWLSFKGRSRWLRIHFA